MGLMALHWLGLFHRHLRVMWSLIEMIHRLCIEPLRPHGTPCSSHRGLLLHQATCRVEQRRISLDGLLHNTLHLPL